MSRTSALSSFPKLLNVKIAEQLNHEIRNGVYPVGSYFPSEKEIAARFSVAQMTIRHALSLLEKKGMILRQHGKKTTVVSAQEKLTIGLLFGPSLTEETAYFYRAILAAFREETPARHWELRVFDALQTRSARLHPQRESLLNQLVQDARNSTFDGLIKIAVLPDDIEEADLATLPSVSMSHHKGADIHLDAYRFGYHAVEELVRNGCKRISYIRTRFEDENFNSSDITGMLDAAKDIGIPLPQVESIYIVEIMGQCNRMLHERTVELFSRWKDLPADQRPNGLVVSDDTVMRVVSMALTQSGLKAPEQVRLICATHDRADFHYVAPVTRYVYPIRQLVHELLRALEAKLNGTPLEQKPTFIQGDWRSEP